MYKKDQKAKQYKKTLGNNSNNPVYFIKRLPEDFSFNDSGQKERWGTIESFDLVDNIDGSTAKQGTRVKLGWTKDYLWAYYHCEDTYIEASIIEHDHKDIWKENAVELFIDPLGLRHVYYELLVNCRNVGLEGIVHLASGKDKIGSGKGIQCLTGWNPESFSHSVTGKGIFNNLDNEDRFWQVEMCIAFKEFYITGQQTPRPGDKWYFNAFRVDSGPWGRNLYAWNNTNIPDFHVSDKFGIMEFA